MVVGRGERRPGPKIRGEIASPKKIAEAVETRGRVRGKKVGKLKEGGGGWKGRETKADNAANTTPPLGGGWGGGWRSTTEWGGVAQKEGGLKEKTKKKKTWWRKKGRCCS